MKKKKSIIIKNPRLQKLRYNLRMVIIKEAHIRKSMLRKKWKEYWEMGNLERAQDFANEEQEISRSINSSICICHVCGSAKKDMVYNPELKTWFCIDCYELNRRYYRSHGQPQLFI